jgi:EAL domain-containing protein (putative c-di-GMP-specific phosphodiesterase class I)
VSLTPEAALAQGKLYCAFQPIVDLARGRIFGYESLARSEAPEFPHPGVLFEAAIATGFTGRLGRAMRQMSVRDCPHSVLFLNMHPDEFAEPWLIRPDDPITLHDQDIYLEVTESVPLSHYQYCHSVLAEIRSRGVKIAIDDLGAGFSNLKYIADLQPDVVKLDRELIAGLTRDSPLHRLVTSLVNLCREMGARVVAEGIETGVELRAVIDTGAHYGQGYHLARPARIPPLIDWPTALAG